MASPFTLDQNGIEKATANNATDLRTDISYLNDPSNVTSSTTYEIDLGQDISLDGNITPVFNSNLNLVVNGANFGIDGAGAYPGFDVVAGKVSLQNLSLTNLAGTDDGAVAGAVYAHGAFASVALQNVIFSGNSDFSGYGADINEGYGASISIDGNYVLFPADGPNKGGSGIFIGGNPVVIGAGSIPSEFIEIDSPITDSSNFISDAPSGELVIGGSSGSNNVYLNPQYPDGTPYENFYRGGTLLNSGTLILATTASAGTGSISFGSTPGGDGVAQTLEIGTDIIGESAVSLGNTLTNFGQGDALDIGYLPYVAASTGVAAPTATYDPTTGLLLVTSGGNQAVFSVAAPAGTNFVVSDATPGVDGGAVEVQLAPPAAPTNPGGGTTPTTPSTPTTTTSPTANNGTNPTVTSPTSNNSIAPTLTFDPNVKVFENQITYSGTTTPGATVALTADTDQPDPIALGTAVGDAASGAWSITYDQFTPGLHDFITGTVTLGGLTTTTASNVDVTTGLGPKQMGFTTIQDNYDAAGDYLGTTFIKGGGGIFARDHHTFLNDGGERYTYTGGSLLKDMQVTSFSASYIDDGNLTGSVLHNDDGTTSIENDAKYQFVNSHHDDSIQEYGSHSHFIFHDGAGHELITGFKLGSDTVALPSDASLDLAKAIQVYDPDANQFDTTIHLGHDLSITFAGVKKDQLLAHASDFTFHA